MSSGRRALVRAAALPAAFCALLACRDAEPPRAPSLAPSFAAVFPVLTDSLMTTSSPSLADLDGDGVDDIVFGTGTDRVRPVDGGFAFFPEPEVSGYVLAVSGRTNRLLWRVPNPRDAFTTPRFAHLNGDTVPDVLMGGREGAFSAFSGRDGALLWRVPPARVARTEYPYNFSRPALIRDANADGIVDIVVVYGGNDLKPPNTPRDPSFLTVVSGRDGAVLRVHVSPDSNEMYMAPVVYTRADGTEWVIFGTGGETHSGAAYRAPVAALLDAGFRGRVERITTPGARKGVIAPATLVELTGDREPDIVISSFDGRLIAVNGATGAALWEQRHDAEESYHPAAVVKLAGSKLGLFVSRGQGAFPRYVATTHRLFDAATGAVLYEFRDTFYPGGAPLAVDLTADGADEPIFFSQRFPSAEGGRIYILDVASRKLTTHDVPTTFGSTPVIADVRGTGTLELIGLSWSMLTNPAAPPGWRDLRSHLHRLDLNARVPASRTWAAYMGTETDGQYHPPQRDED